jgi:hypothetical protein
MQRKRNAVDMRRLFRRKRDGEQRRSRQHGKTDRQSLSVEREMARHPPHYLGPAHRAIERRQLQTDARRRACTEDIIEEAGGGRQEVRWKSGLIRRRAKSDPFY